MVSTLVITYRKPITWIYLLLVFISVIIQLQHPRTLIDTQEYLQSVQYYWNTETLKIDAWHGDRWMFPVRRTPLYPFVLYLMKIPGVAIFQGILAIIIPAILEIRILGLKHGTLSNMYWIWWILTPLQFFYSALPMPEMIAQALVTLWLWSITRKHLAYNALSLTLLVMLKPIFLVWLIPFGLFLIFGVIKRNIKHSLLFTLIPVLGIVSLWMHNANRWHYNGISSIGVTNSYEYNRYMLLKQELGPEAADSVYQRESEFLKTMHQLDPQKGGWMQQQVIQSVLTYPFTYAYIHLKGSLQMFVDPGRYDAMVCLNWQPRVGFMKVKDSQGMHAASSRPWYEWIYIGVFFLVNLAKLAFLFWAIRMVVKTKKSVSEPCWLVLVAIVLYALAIGPVGTARYLVPLYPLLLFMVVSKFPPKKTDEDFTVE